MQHIDTSSINSNLNFTTPFQALQPTPPLECTSTQLFFNNENFKDNILIELNNQNITNNGCFLHEKFNEIPLPKLTTSSLGRLCQTLTKRRCIQDKSNKFKIEFTLQELFEFIYSKKSKRIESVELVGSSVAWVLGDYILEVFSKIGLKNLKPEDLERFLGEFGRYPSDFDFRILLSPSSSEDLQDYNNLVLEFLVQKALLNTKESQKELKTHILNRGFSKFSDPILNDGNYCTTIGIQDVSGDCFDLIFAQKLKRPDLFILDAIKIIVTDLIFKYQSKPLESINIIPTGRLRNGYQAILDRISGLARAIEPETIDFTGWTLLLTSYVKGRRSLESEQEVLLFNKLKSQFSNANKDNSLPKALQKELKRHAHHQQTKTRLVTGLVFLLQKCVSNHLKNHPTAVFFLSLQVCQKLHQENLYDELDDFLQRMGAILEFSTENTLALELYQAVGDSRKDFLSFMSWLQVKAFLFFSAETPASSTTDGGISFQLIHHQGHPALQMELDGYSFLCPFQPLSALQSLAELEVNLSSKHKLGKLNTLLATSGTYTGKKKSLLSRHAEACSFDLKPVEDLYESILQAKFLQPWQVKCIEWLLAYSNIYPESYANGILESLFPKFLSNIHATQDQQHIITSYMNKAITETETAVYHRMIETISKNKLSASQLYLHWGLALAEFQTPDRILTCYNIWKQHAPEVTAKEKHELGYKYISLIGRSRADLAVSIWEDLFHDNPSIKLLEDTLTVLIKCMKEQPQRSETSLLQLVKPLDKLSVSLLKKPQEVPSLHAVLGNLHHFTLILLENRRVVEASKFASRLCFLWAECLEAVGSKESAISAKKIHETQNGTKEGGTEETMHPSVKEDSGVIADKATIYANWSKILKAFLKYGHDQTAASLWLKLFLKFNFAKDSACRIDCIEFLMHGLFSGIEKETSVVTFFLKILDTLSQESPLPLLQIQALCTHPLAAVLLPYRPDEASQILLKLADSASTNETLYRKYTLDIFKQLLQLISVLPTDRQFPVIEAFSRCLSVQTESLEAEEELNTLLTSQQHFIFNMEFACSHETLFKSLLKEMACHKLCLELFPQTTQCLYTFLEKQLSSIHKKPSFEFLDVVLWILDHSEKSADMQPIQSFYYSSFCACQDDELLLQESLLVTSYLNFVEKSGLPSDEIAYLNVTMNLIKKIITADDLLFQKLIHHQLAVIKDHENVLAKDMFKLLQGHLYEMPLRSIIVLDQQFKLFHQHIEISDLQEHITRVLQHILKAKNYDLLKIFFLIPSKGYTLTFEQWKLILADIGGMDYELHKAISIFLLPDFETVLLSFKYPKERLAFCLTILDAGQKHPSFLINMLSIAKMVITSLDDASLQSERLDFIEKLFVHSAEKFFAYQLEYIPDLLQIWLNAFRSIEAELKVNPQDIIHKMEQNISALNEKKVHLLNILEQTHILLVCQAGNEEQFARFMQELPQTLSRMNVNSKTLMETLNKLILHLTSQRKIPFLQLTLAWIDQNVKLDVPTLDFYCRLAEHKLEPDEILSVLEIIHNTKNYIETGCVLALQYFFTHKTLPKPTAKKILHALVKSLTKIESLNTGVSPLITIYLLKLPSQNLSDYPEATPILNLLFKIHDVSRTEANSKRLVMLSKVYGSTFFKRPEIYKPCMPILAHAFEEIYRADPKEFIDYLDAYIIYLSKSLCIIHKSEKIRVNIISMLICQILEYRLSIIDLESINLDQTLNSLSYFFGVLLENRMIDVEHAEKLVFKFIYLPLPDTNPSLQTHHFTKNLPELLELLSKKNLHFFTAVHKYELFLLSNQKKYLCENPTETTRQKAFESYIQNLLQMKTLFATEVAVCEFINDHHKILKSMRQQQLKDFYNLWKEFISAICRSTHFSKLSSGSINFLYLTYMTFVNDCVTKNVEDAALHLETLSEFLKHILRSSKTLGSEMLMISSSIGLISDDSILMQSNLDQEEGKSG